MQSTGSDWLPVEPSNMTSRAAVQTSDNRKI